MELTSPAFKNGETIPKKHTGEAEDVSPELDWSGAPAETKAFAVVMDDPDAPPGAWIHWVIYDIPAAATKLAESTAKAPELPDGSRQGACWGVEGKIEFERVGYHGPLPPPGKPHHYSFRLYALDAPTGLAAKATKAQLEKAMKKHLLAKAELIGLYQR